jgi:hypothetical protein
MSSHPNLGATNSFLSKGEKSTAATPTEPRRKLRLSKCLFLVLPLILISILKSSALYSPILWSFRPVFRYIHKADDMSTSHSNSRSNNLEGWHAHATESTSVTPSSFDPKLEDIVVTIIKSSMRGKTFTMALVKPNLAIDSNGRILSLSPAEFAQYQEMVDAVNLLPRTGNWDQWRVKHSTTCWPIDKILIPGQGERSVYGWEEPGSWGTLKLESRTNGYTHLPQEITQLLRLAKEAWKGYDHTKGPLQERVVQKILALQQ